MILFRCIGYKWKKAQVASTLDSHREATLIFQACTSDATWQDLALVVQEFPQEIGVFVVDVLDPVALEAAVFLGHVGRLDLIHSRRPDASIFGFCV
jgi:hypothetical protein